MSIFFSKNVSPQSFRPCKCEELPSCSWLSIGSIFQWGASSQEITYQRKVQLVSSLFEASLSERLNLLADLGWSIDAEEEVAIHPQGEIYSFEELEAYLNEKLSKIFAATCLFAETIGYQYKKTEGIFTNGEDVVSIETLGSWAKNRQLWG